MTEKKRRRGMCAAPLVTLPEWTVGVKDGYGLGAAISLAGYEDEWIHLSAATQRTFLGFPVFGKHTIHFDGEVFRVLHSTVGGGYTSSHTAAEVANAARDRRKL